MNTEPQLTDPQRSELSKAFGSKPIEGLITFSGYGMGVGLHRRTWERMMSVLQERGYVIPYVHGGYEITAKGRAAYLGLAFD